MRKVIRIVIRLVSAAAVAGSFLTTYSCYGQSPTLMSWNSPLAQPGGPNLDKPIVTDRPDFTEASSTVGRGVVQIESGYTYFSDTDGITETRTHSYPESLLRVGMFADWFELRCAFFYGTEEVNGVRDFGAEDLYLGAKLALTGQAGILPEMAIVPQITVPTGAAIFSADEVLPGVNFLYSWEVNDFISTAGSTQFNREIETLPGTGYSEFIQSWTIGYSLAEKLVLTRNGSNSCHTTLNMLATKTIWTVALPSTSLTTCCGISERG